LFGGDISIVKDKIILECGCGAGRFTEILLSEGASVMAIDLSSAVEANYETCRDFKNYFVCQADIYGLPVESNIFDIVCCVGVIQHTPDSEKTIQTLCSYVKPGGLLVIDHYTYGYPDTPVRKGFRMILVHCPSEYSLKIIKMVTSVFWPIHLLLWRYHQNSVMQKLRQAFLYVSPIVDYHDAYPDLDENLLKLWALLDTHDTLTDVYKHLRSAEEIFSYLEKCGMTLIQTCYAGNGVEARAIKPLK
jgi:SAM-dependent methyltransferase